MQNDICRNILQVSFHNLITGVNGNMSHEHITWIQNSGHEINHLSEQRLISTFSGSAVNEVQKTGLLWNKCCSQVH